jgi:signal transduction histidine kinase
MADNMLVLDDKLLDTLFPCRLHTSSDHRIVAAGPSLLRWNGAGLIGARVADEFQILRPRRAALVSGHTLFILRSKRVPALIVRGQAVAAHAGGLHFLLGAVPTDAVRSAVALKHSDFAPSDGATELLMSLLTRETLLEEAKALARLLTEARDAAESANRIKSTFISTMSHELRTPLNAIIGYSEMIEEHIHGTDAADSARDVQKILVAARHLLHLINEVLDLAKIEAGKAVANLTEVNFSELLCEVADTIAPLVLKNDNRLTVEIAPDLGLGRSDPLKLRQCVLNLMGNAAKFTSRGEISLLARRAGADSERVEIIIADTGFGMSREQVERLFQPFSQASASTARVYGGTGLGLVITRRLAQLLGGDVSVESAEGKGSRFTLDIPTHATPATAPLAAPALACTAA